MSELSVKEAMNSTLTPMAAEAAGNRAAEGESMQTKGMQGVQRAQDAQDVQGLHGAQYVQNTLGTHSVQDAQGRVHNDSEVRETSEELGTSGANSAVSEQPQSSAQPQAKAGESQCIHATEQIHVKSKTYERMVMLAGFASVSTATLLILMKFVVWLLSGSSTILASLTDSLLDLGASFVNLLALRFALKPADRDHRFGHYKAEALSSLTQAAFIGGSALFLMAHGYARLRHPIPLAYIDVAIYVSIASVLLTLGLTWFQGYVCRLTHSEAVAADRFHYLSDILLNLSVILSLVLSSLGYIWADGVFSMLLGLFIIRSSWHIGVTAISTLLDRSLGVPENSQIIREIIKEPCVKSFHDLRTRKAGPQYFIQCHIVLPHDMPLEQAHNVADRVERNISKWFPDADIMLHMEPDVAETYKDIQFIDSNCAIPAVAAVATEGAADATETSAAAAASEASDVSAAEHASATTVVAEPKQTAAAEPEPAGQTGATVAS